ncbi:MAG: asparagine synthase (glutamine-hydrolyzing) [bacterium]|nr:asparagine synthase (glutamine-hydrolyzing) [bacterium]
MCGIAGLYDLTQRGRATVEPVRRMCSAIRHRGPDGDGFFEPPDHLAALGMRRLSIIDVAGSDQPLFNENGTISMVFNGEIYNYRELRADLLAQGHHPRTDGDGETLIHLYEQVGLNTMFRHLRGMYAFALWDSQARRLVIAVDHIGMKPLYYAEHDGLLIFASEVKALIAAGVPAALNPAVLDTYLTFGYMIGDQTLFAGVRRLMPGHVLTAHDGQYTIEPYWDFPRYTADAEPRRDESSSLGVDWVARARDLIAESVRLHLRADVPLGLFLSGGIDSAAILSLMAGYAAEAGGQVKTFTVGYASDTPDNELIHARRIAAHFGTDHHERVITADDWWNGFQRYVYHHDEPNANSSAISLLLLSELTAQQVKVVLTGLGGDELFGGYANHRAIPAVLRQQARYGGGIRPLAGLLDALERFYPAMKRYRYIGALPTYLPRVRAIAAPRDDALRRLQSFDGLVFTEHTRRWLYAPPLIDAWHSEKHKEKTFAAIVERSHHLDADQFAQALIINTWLHGNALLNADKVTMAHSLEARVPFFDPALLAFAAQIPGSVRMTSNKIVLRAAMQPLLPAFALERPKQPFGTPILGWFGRELSGRIQTILRDSSAFVRDWLRPAALDALLDGHFSGRAPQVEVVFRLLTLELWAQRFLK